MTRKVVSIHCMCKVCAKCKTNQEHPPAMCPKNWEGSSKAMEGHGAVINAKLLYAKRVIIDELVMDDDSLTTALLKPMVHRTLRTGRVETKGALPEDYPKTPTDLADTNHRLKCLSSQDWGLAYAPLQTATWTTADAAKLKKNTSFTVKQNRHKPVEEFQKDMYQVLKHHFNRLNNCG
jgi:hypothetical protein